MKFKRSDGRGPGAFGYVSGIPEPRGRRSSAQGIVNPDLFPNVAHEGGGGFKRQKFPQDEVSNMAVADSQTASQAGPSKLAEASSSSPAAVFKRLHPAQYLSRFLVQGYRPDGRETRAWRDVSVNAGMSAYFLHMASYYSYFTGNLPTEITGSISTADGSALVRMGDTTMVCGIKAEIAEPDMTRPNEGFLSEYLSFQSCVTPPSTQLPQLN